MYQVKIKEHRYGVTLTKIFWTIAEEGTISQAAEVLHLTQPTLSRQLKELEEELGTELFVRENRKMILTEAGYFLKSRAEEILDLTNQTTQEFENRKNNYSAADLRSAV